MYRILALFALVCTVLIGGAEASFDSVREVTIDGRKCDFKDGAFVSDNNRYNIRVKGQEKGQATLEFTYQHDGHAVSEVLVAAQQEKPFDFSLHHDHRYDPSKTLDIYVKGLNDLFLQGLRQYEWNTDGAVTLGKDELQPVVTLGKRQTIKFHKWEVKHYKDKGGPDENKTVVLVPFGFDGEEPAGRITIEKKISHVPFPSALPDFVYLDQHMYLRGLKSVAWKTISELDAGWAWKNDITACEQYVTLEHDGPLIVALDAREADCEKYYKLVGSQWLDSTYIYADGDGHYFMTKLMKATLNPVQPAICGVTGYKFNSIATNNLTVQTLEKTDYPLTLYENTVLNTPFRQGYYRLSRSDSLGQVYEEMNNSQNVVTCLTSGYYAPFSKTDLTEKLLKSDDNGVVDLFECLKHFRGDLKSSSKPKVVVRLASKPEDEIKKVSDRLVRFIGSFGISILDVDKLCIDQAPLTDHTLYFFWLKKHDSNPENRSVRKIELTEQWQLKENLEHLAELVWVKPESFKCTYQNLGLAPSYAPLLTKFIKENPNLTELHLNGPVSELDKDFFRMVADHPKLGELHIRSLEKKNLQGLTWEQLGSLFIKVRGLEILDLPVGSLPRRFACPDAADSLMASCILRNTISNSVENLAHLSLPGVTGMKSHGSELVAAVGRMPKLKSINLMGGVLDNFDTVEMAKVMSRITDLRVVSIAMPYWVKMIYGLVRGGIREWASINSLGDFAGCVGGTVGFILAFPAVATVGIGMDLTGEQGVEYDATCNALAGIPNLTSLTLELTGVRTYEDWTKAKILTERQKLRKKQSLSDVEIKFAK